MASAHSYILLFSSKGRVYWLKVYEIPEAAAAARGEAISSLVKFQEDEHLTAVIEARDLNVEGIHFLRHAQRHGEEKLRSTNSQSALDGHHRHQPGTGRRVTHLTDGKKMIFLASHDGQAILFRETEVRSMGRNAGGVNGMDLAKGDYLVRYGARATGFRNYQERIESRHPEYLDDIENGSH